MSALRGVSGVRARQPHPCLEVYRHNAIHTTSARSNCVSFRWGGV